MQRPVRPEDGVVTAFRDGVVTLRSNRRTTGFTEALQEIGYQGIRKGDLVIHEMDAFAGAIGVSDSDGKGTPVYSVCQPTGDANSWYYALVLREMSRSGYLLSLAKGIRERSTDFRFADFASLMVPLPPVEEQEQIVRFVRHLDSKVNRLIKAKRRLIELLNEQKHAIIHQAVTRGLDPTVPLKPSGIDWLGDIPAHWKLRRIRSVVSSSMAGVWGNDPVEDNSADHITCLRVADFDMNSLGLRTDKLTLRAIPASARAARLLRSGDILMEKSGGGDAEPVGRVVLFDLDIPAVTSNFVTRIRPDSTVVDQKYLLYVLAFLQATRRNVPSIKQTTGIQNIDEKHYFSSMICIPPLEEQRTIVAELEAQLLGLRAAVGRIHAETDLIREYRTRLVADVVTGQLDVRHLMLLTLDEIDVEAPEAEEVDDLDLDSLPEDGVLT